MAWAEGQPCCSESVRGCFASLHKPRHPACWRPSLCEPGAVLSTSRDRKGAVKPTNIIPSPALWPGAMAWLEGQPCCSESRRGCLLLCEVASLRSTSRKPRHTISTPPNSSDLLCARRGAGPTISARFFSEFFNHGPAGNCQRGRRCATRLASRFSERHGKRGGGTHQGPAGNNSKMLFDN